MAVKRIGGTFHPWTKIKTVEGITESPIYAARKNGQVTLSCTGLVSNSWVAEANVIANLPAWALPMGGVDAPRELTFIAMTKGSYDAGVLTSESLVLRGTVWVETGEIMLHIPELYVPMVGNAEIAFVATYPSR